MDVRDVLAALGLIGVSVITAASAIWAAFKWIAKRWIDQKFSAKFESLKHANAIDLAKMKVEVDARLGGVTRLHEKEFEVLPKAWHRLVLAFHGVAGLVAPVQTYADLEGMGDLRLEEFLSESKLTDADREEIRQADKRERNEIYQRFRFYRILNDARNACARLNRYLQLNAVFLPADIRQAFDEVATALWLAVTEKHVGHEAEDWKMQVAAWEKVDSKIKPLYTRVDQAIQARLQSQPAA